MNNSSKLSGTSPAAQVREISRCRICGNPHLEPVLDLGMQSLTGVFPDRPDAKVMVTPLELVKCAEDGSGRTCGLVQLRHSVEQTEMFGEGYGYRSGINQTMTRHLQAVVEEITGRVSLGQGDFVLDIGSNDCTLLKSYPQGGFDRAGIDPSGGKFREFYPEDVALAVDFFSPAKMLELSGGRKAKVITSIAMFYDIEAPQDFMADIKSVLADDGIWVFEQSYMPQMLAQNAYDTICQEHLSYYGLRQIKWMTDRAGLKIVDVDMNDINGGSFRITAAKAESSHQPNTGLIESILAREAEHDLAAMEPYLAFRDRVFRHREELNDLLDQFNRASRLVLGYGASTKGNVIIQFCGLTREQMPAIADRNPTKDGLFTPGTGIPIISEAEGRRRDPACFLAFPWHFKTEFVQRERPFLESGGRLLFPLPFIHLADQKSLG